MRDLNAVALKGKRVLLRIDINSPMEDGKVVLNPRFQEHAKSIRELAEKSARLILLSHQGRKGKSDFTSLEQHAKLLESMVGKAIRFVPDVAGEKAKEAIQQLQDGEILLLDNVRLLEDEETGHPHEATLVKELSPLADLFVLDAFSIAHRAHASVVGFAHSLPCYPGPVLAREVQALQKANRDGVVTFLIGGSKIHDAYLILKRWLHLGRVEKVLVAGVPGILGLYARGYNVGKSHGLLTHEHFVNEKAEMEELFEKFSGYLELPLDVGVERDRQRLDVPVSEIGDSEIKDIGRKTIAHYGEHIRKAGVIIMNGSPGVYEENGFSEGTKAILQMVAEGPAYSLIGGGHTIAAIEKFGIPKEKFGYISLSGKAFLEYLEGKELPGLNALEGNESRLFEK